MGIVYQARDEALGRTVALKTMALAATVPEELRDQFEKRFYQEARAAASLQHPGIVVVYEIGIDEKSRTPYIALEFLKGKTLEKVLAEGPRPWMDALRIGARLAEALQEAHSNGVVHRDLKPANVMILASGEPKIMDFGVAKLEASMLTTQGQVFGSPSYMAPELALEARTDARSDVFSLGCVLYELVTGQRAFTGRTLSDILMRLSREEPAPPSQVVAGLPAAIDAVVAFALAKAPERRYPTAGALAEDLGELLAGRPARHAAAQKPKATAVPVGAPAAAPADGAQTRISGSPGGALALPPGKRVSLAFLSGPRSGEVYVLHLPSVLIGREGGGGGAQIELKDSQVSRAHAVFECRGPRFVLRDLESTNGTYVNGQRIREQELEDRTEFQVGVSRIVVILADAD
jgi:serine/threonine-protein kinase